MKKIVKKIICFAMAVFMLVSVIQVDTVQAETNYSKTQVTKMMKKYKKDLSVAQKKLNAEKKKYQKQIKGTKYILYGSVISTHPYIICDGITKSYYWVTNPKAMTTVLSMGMGHVKPTGKYRTYNRITCAEAKAVKITANTGKYSSKVGNLKDKIAECKNALNQKVVFDTSDENKIIDVDASKDIAWKFQAYDPYNTVKFTSSDPSILKITDDKYCTVKGMKEGTVTITATTSCSKKISKLSVTVEKQYSEITGMYFARSYSGTNTICLRVNIYSKSSDTVYPLKDGDPHIYIGDEKIASIDSIECGKGSYTDLSYTIKLRPEIEGTTFICAESASGKIEKLPLEVFSTDEGTLAIKLNGSIVE